MSNSDTSGGTGFIWFWKNDQESWTPYSDEHQDAIERARIQGEDHVILQIGSSVNNHYLLDFTDQVQENLALGHRRLISRANEFTVWYWRDDDGITWNLYEQEHADALTRAEAEQEPEVYLVIRETLYRIDLPRRLQINFDNHSADTREIRQGRGLSTSIQPLEQNNNSHNNTNHPLEPPNDDDHVDPLDAVAPQSFLCPISFHIMKDPVTTSAGSTYDRQNIQWWLNEHDTDPLTKRPIRDKLLVPNNALKQTIQDWKQDYVNNLSSADADADLNSKPAAKTTTTQDDDDTISTLKVVVLGGNKMGSTSIVQKLVVNTDNNNGNSSTPGVHIYDWRPNQNDIQFQFWDFQGQDALHAYRSIGFTPQTLYIVVWDMGISAEENASLQRDIHTKVQFWIDRIQERVGGAVILPVASFADAFHPHPHHHHLNCSRASSSSQGGRCLTGGEKEAKRRCQILKEELLKSASNASTILFGDDDDPVLRVSGSSSAQKGMDQLQQILLELGSKSGLFDHIGRSATDGFRRSVRQTIRAMKEEGCKMINVDWVANALARKSNPTTTNNNSMLNLGPTLSWLSNIGQVLYFPTMPSPFDKILILDIPWYFGLCGCILRHDWKVLVSDGRRRKGRDAAPTFGGAVNENCPVLSKEDASMLWLNYLATTDFGRSLSAESFTLTDVLDYVLTLMIHMGVLIPLDQDLGPLSSRQLYSQDLGVTKTPQQLAQPSASSSLLNANLLCIPNLLRKGDHGKGLNDISFVAGSTTRLAQKVQFKGNVPDILMEKVIVAMLRNITTRLKENEASNNGGHSIVALERVHCWRSIFRIRLSWKKSNGNGEKQETTVEVCSQLVEGAGDDHGTHACLFTSANVIKGDGQCIWEAGYGLVLETIQAVVKGQKGVKFATSVFCHDCLASRGIHGSHSWGMDEIEAARNANMELKCRSGHIASLQLLTGTGSGPSTKPSCDLDSTLQKKAIVLVGLYDARRRTNKVRRVGSGVIVDASRGLIVTAARNVMKIEGEAQFGQNYDGILGGKVVVGVLPDDESEEAVFRYYAKIVTKDSALTDRALKICRIDACVLKITSRFECDVEGNGDTCCDEIELLLRDNAKKIAAQRLVELPLQPKSNLEDRILIFGYKQSNGVSGNRHLTHVAGYICQKKSATCSEADQFKYRPVKTTVVMASAKPGYIGGPCLNQQGEIVGILACGDPDEDSRSFVVPVSEWRELVRMAAAR